MPLPSPSIPNRFAATAWTEGETGMPLIDGALGAQFLQAIVDNLENPMAMLA